METSWLPHINPLWILGIDRRKYCDEVFSINMLAPQKNLLKQSIKMVSGRGPPLLVCNSIINI